MSTKFSADFSTLEGKLEGKHEAGDRLATRFYHNPEQTLAPQVGLEPTTLRLTAECSAIELLRIRREAFL